MCTENGRASTAPTTAPRPSPPPLSCSDPCMGGNTRWTTRTKSPPRSNSGTEITTAPASATSAPSAMAAMRSARRPPDVSNSYSYPDQRR